MTGIPIATVLKRLSDMDGAGERHKFHARIQNDNAEKDFSELNLIRDVEKEFTSEAENILERLQLSHMRSQGKKAHH